jgi:hypothetical protein
MKFFKKKDKRYNTYFDNYSNKIAGNFTIAIVYVVIGLIVYGGYKLYHIIF